MGSALSSDGRQGTPAPGSRGSPEGIQPVPPQLGRDGGEKPPQDPHQSPSFDCSICLEVLHQPVRTRCGHVGLIAWDAQVCLSEMRAHLRTCDQYIEKYGPLQEVAYPETRYPCPFCQYELDENDLLDHFLTYHRSERRQVSFFSFFSLGTCLQYCPICRLLPGGGPSYYSRTFMRHLQLRHTFYYEDYIDIDVVEEVLIERVLDQSFLDYVHVNSSNVV
ncbi:hypothetical protein JD844_016294 [Phrynosoma platyrhinos]|uniref:RING-type E3 ubiquitin transferase n=1 Tax=Phrynosoma platyrhinos TaxID=52577 RepID=A0ABQ7SK67_PHRPL|nr:hypothetical protein JD844_016294 [Phrynosoma platyrhinos]